MTKEEKINVILSHLKAAEAQVRDGILLLNELLAEYDAGETFAEYRRSFFHVVHSTSETPKKKNGGNYKFSSKEIETMPLFYKNLFIAGDVVAHWRTRTDGLVEIRCQIQGKKITASGKTEKRRVKSSLKN